MCENVIIHMASGRELICKDQQDLNLFMRKGLCFEPPLTPAEEWYYLTEDGKFQAPQNLHDPLNDLDHGYHSRYCLCPVDLEKTAKINGFRYSKKDVNGEYDPFDTHFYLLNGDDNKEDNDGRF